MSDRSATSLTDIVGPGLGPQQANFKRAIAQKDPNRIAATAATLVAKSQRVGDILYYASKLAAFVRTQAKSKRRLNYEQRIRLARREWSRVKREEGIHDDPVITNALVSAAAKAIGKGSAK